MQEKSNSFSCVSKQLIEFILFRAQRFPVKCLKICLVYPLPISSPSHALCRDVSSAVRILFHSGAVFSERSTQRVNFYRVLSSCLCSAI